MFRASLCPSSGEQDCLRLHVVWSWDVSSVHSVEVATSTLCTLLTSQVHTTTASTNRQTPHAVLNNLVLLTMGTMMPETCWESINHEKTSDYCDI